MGNENIIKGISECELIMVPDGNYLRIECDPASLRVIDLSSYIKLNVLSPRNCVAYKVTIKVETMLRIEEKEK